MKIMNNDGLLYGGDYNPDQWLKHPEILREDLRLMKKAHINTVTLGMFSWAKLEPEEGRYEFKWLEEIIDRMYKNGISVILGTPSGARPHWLAEKYPEVLRTDESRRKQLFGMRHNHCYTSPVYREKTQSINRRLAETFDAHPGVILWHISNEYGGECHCELCQKSFRDWVKEKYKTIEEVNRCWNTSFWSHDYSSFEQIESPSTIGEESIDGLVLDWKRFVTYQTIEFMKCEIRAIRSTGSTKPVTTNMMYNFKDLNYHEMAKELDYISWDCYPFWGKNNDSIIATDTGLQHDLMRSLKKQPFFMMESCPGATNWQPISKLKRPGVLAAQSFQAIAHGSDSVLYFQIRKGRGGSEKFHGALIDHSGREDDRTFIECCEVGNGLEQLKQVTGCEVSSQAAIIYDWENWWAMENSQGPRNQGMHYYDTVLKSYKALRNQGLNVDIIDMTQELKEYKLVIAPMLYMFRNGIQRKIREFVDAGGCFVLTYWSGIVDEHDLCCLGGTPGDLMDVMGLRTTEIDGLYDEDLNYIMPCYNMCDYFGTPKEWWKDKYEIRNLCQLAQLDAAIPLMFYADDFYAGSPAFTVNQYGKGYAYYVGADVEQSFYEDVYKVIAEKHAIKSPIQSSIPGGVEITTRENEKEVFLFIQNFNTKEVAINNVHGELIFSDQRSIDGNKNKSNNRIQLNPYETIVLRQLK